MNYIKSIIIAALILVFVNQAFSSTAVELMNEGRMTLYKGDIPGGIRLLEEANRMDNNNPYIKIILAKGYSWNNEWDRAKSLYSEIVLSSKPDEQIYWEAKFGIAQITSWEKKYNESLGLYEEILTSYKKIPKHFKLDIGLAMGDIHSWNMENDKAFAQFNKLLDENPGNTVILNRIAKLYLWQGEYAKSREYTSQVLSIDSKDADSAERMRVLDQIKPFTLIMGYNFTYYDSKNDKGEKVKVHNVVQGLDWQYSVPLKVFAYVNEVRQNSIESSDPAKTSEWNYDADFRGGGTYRINPLTYISVAGDYAYNAKIFPDLSTEISLSRKLNQNVDIEGLYKFTYDKIDSAQTVKSKQYHLVSPGIVIYYNPSIYNKLLFFVESDTKDLFYSVLIQQYLAFNPENIFQFYLFLSQGRSYLVFSDSTILQKTTTYSVSLLYTHFFTPSWGVEISTGLLTSVNKYSNYHSGISVIYKW